MHISTLSKNIFIAGLLLANGTPNGLYAASAEESDTFETSVLVTDQAQEQSDVANATEDQWIEASESPELSQEQLQEQPEYPDNDDAQTTENQESSDTTDANDANDANDAEADNAQPETVNAEEILAQVVAQPQPQQYMPFNRYAFGATINMQAIQQFIAEQAGHLAATLLFASTKQNGLEITDINGKSVFYAQRALLFALRLINFSSIGNAIVASFETEATTSNEEMHAKAFKDGLPYAAASALASFVSTALNRLFYIYH